MPNALRLQRHSGQADRQSLPHAVTPSGLLPPTSLVTPQSSPQPRPSANHPSAALLVCFTESPTHCNSEALNLHTVFDLSCFESERSTSMAIHRLSTSSVFVYVRSVVHSPMGNM